MTNQDWSLCPEDPGKGPGGTVEGNLVLKFRVQNTVNSEFEDYIDHLDVFLFDSTRSFMEHTEAVTSESDGSRSATFTVSPGLYHVVCWGNVSSYSLISEMTDESNLENSYVEITPSEEGYRTTDPIYYAPHKTPRVRTLLTEEDSATRADDTPGEDYDIYAVSVSPGERTVRELVFVKVHRQVEIFVSGYEDTPGYDGRGPIIEYTNGGSRFDFLLRGQGDPRTFRRETELETRNEEDIYHTDINSMLVPINGSEQVNLYHPTDGEMWASLNIREYIDANSKFFKTDDSYIPIHVRMNSDTSVSVTIPSWVDVPIVTTPIR
jgi:hypothetical protein